MKKEDKILLWYIIVFCLTVIGLYILSCFQYEKCNEEGWLKILFVHILSLFFTGLCCIGFLFFVFIIFGLFYWIVNDDLKKIINSISPIDFSKNERETNHFYVISIAVVIFISGYFIWGDFIYGCI